MKQFRLVDEKASVHSAPDVTSSIVAELHAGEVVGIRKAVKISGVDWAVVKLADGKGGYVAPPFLGVFLRRVTLAQDSVDVFETPAEGSQLKATYRRGESFTVGTTVTQGETKWVEVLTRSGEFGFITGGTKTDGVGEIIDEEGKVSLLIGILLILAGTGISGLLGWGSYVTGLNIAYAPLSPPTTNFYLYLGISLSLIFTADSVVLGYFLTKRKHAPLWYLLISGLVPGFMLHGGWRLVDSGLDKRRSQLV